MVHFVAFNDLHLITSFTIMDSFILVYISFEMIKRIHNEHLIHPECLFIVDDMKFLQIRAYLLLFLSVDW